MTNVDVALGDADGQLGGAVRDGEPEGAVIIELRFCGIIPGDGGWVQRGGFSVDTFIFGEEAIACGATVFVAELLCHC